MTNIRFFYDGKDLDEGKKYFKSTKDYKYNNLQDVVNEYKSILKYNNQDEALITHPAKCPAMNSIKASGWVTLNDYELSGNAMPEDGVGPSHVTGVFPNYTNSNDYVILKYHSKWRVNIPSGYYLTSIPTLYHTGNWFSLPGNIDPDFNQYKGHMQLNSFIIMKKNDIIPIGTPIAQWVLIKKEMPEVSIELINEFDQEQEELMNYLDTLKFNDYEKYKLVKRSELFQNWSNEHE